MEGVATGVTNSAEAENIWKKAVTNRLLWIQGGSTMKHPEIASYVTSGWSGTMEMHLSKWCCNLNDSFLCLLNSQGNTVFLRLNSKRAVAAKHLELTKQPIVQRQQRHTFYLNGIVMFM